jgi:hypothetical protein
MTIASAEASAAEIRWGRSKSPCEPQVACESLRRSVTTDHDTNVAKVELAPPCSIPGRL